MAFAPNSDAWLIIRSKASLRVFSHNSVSNVMLPPTSVCSPAPIVPNSDRDLTIIPLTSPMLRVTRQPSRVKVVVTIS